MAARVEQELRVEVVAVHHSPSNEPSLDFPQGAQIASAPVSPRKEGSKKSRCLFFLPKVY